MTAASLGSAELTRRSKQPQQQVLKSGASKSHDAAQPKLTKKPPRVKPIVDPLSGFKSTPSIYFEPLPSLSSPSPAYLATLAQLVEFRTAVVDELTRIEEEVARLKATRTRTTGNAYETPRKKYLSAHIELTRMEWMEEPTVAQLLYTSSHFAADDIDAKMAFDATPAMQECTHILALYEELRMNLVVRARKRSRVLQAIRLVIILLYFICYVPIFVAGMALAPLNWLWTLLFDARNHFFPVDLVQKWFSRGFLLICQIQVEWIGLENIVYDQSIIGMFSHASNLDPVIVASGPLAFKWIGKKSLFRAPILGWMLTGLQHIPIERENREKAMASLKQATITILEHKRCVAVSPEGTRSRSGRITDFKKGPFHTAMQVGVPIIPLLIEGAYELWPSGSIFAAPGKATVTVLPPIHIAQEDTYVTLASRVRKAFLTRLRETAIEQGGGDDNSTSTTSSSSTSTSLLYARQLDDKLTFRADAKRSHSQQVNGHARHQK